MTSSMLAGERRWASARRGGMTVLGKVAVPKPINLPSQRLENHGLDPSVEIVPKGTVSWGSRSSPSATNAWGSAKQHPNSDGGPGSPSHLSGRPSSVGSSTRPSTADSERAHEPSANAWGPNSRPLSASGILASGQTPQITSRPRSAETRPRSSQLSRFAGPPSDNFVAWGPSNAADKLGLSSSKNDEFALSSGDFPTLGSEKDNSGKHTESQDHGSYGRPHSSSGGTAKPNDRNVTSPAGDSSVNTNAKGPTVNTWRRDSFQHVEDGVRPSLDKWQGDPQPFINTSVPQQFDAWHGPPLNAPPAGVWYRGPPGVPPYGAPVPPGGFPLEAFPYYHPQIPANALANSQGGPMPGGTGPRGPHPKSGDMFRPHGPDAFIHPGMPIRPGFYHGPLPYDGYYGPPMGYCNSNDRDIPLVGMAAGQSVYSRYPGNAPDPNNYGRPSSHGSTVKTMAPERVDSAHHDDNKGPYKVLLKQHNEWDAKDEEGKSELSLPTNSPHPEEDQLRASSWKTEGMADHRKEKDIRPRRVLTGEHAPSQTSENREGYSLDTGKHKLPERRGNLKAVDGSLGKESENTASSLQEVPLLGAIPKDSTLIQKVEGLNAKARTSDGRHDVKSFPGSEGQKNRVQVNARANHSGNVAVPRAAYGERTRADGDVVPAYNKVDVFTEKKILQSAAAGGTTIPRGASHGEQGRLNHREKKSSPQDSDGWRKKPLAPESTSVVSAASSGSALTVKEQECHTSSETSETSGIILQEKVEGESLTPMFDPSDLHAQRAKMREIAQQRAKQLQKEEEERTKEQKAKALAKLEELNRRIQATDGSTQKMEKVPPSGLIQKDMEESQPLSEAQIVEGISEIPNSALVSEANVVAQASDSTIPPGDTLTETAGNVCPESVVSQGQLLPSHQDAHIAGVGDGKAVPLISSTNDSGRRHYKQKQNTSSEKNLTEKSIPNSKKEAAPRNDIDVPVNTAVPVEVAGEIGPGCESSSSINPSITVEVSAQLRRKNSRNSKSKQKPDDAPSPLPNESKPIKASDLDLDPNSVQSLADLKNTSQQPSRPQRIPSEEAHSRLNNQGRSHQQQPRRTPRAPQAHRPAEKFHVSDSVVWAPVRSHNKPELIDEASPKTPPDVVTSAVKCDNNSVQNNSLKSKRAEMERYVPKPVAKELAQQGSVQQQTSESGLQSSDNSQSSGSSIGNVRSVTESKNGDGKHSKSSKGQASWRQRTTTTTESPSQGLQDISSVDRHQQPLISDVNSEKVQNNFSEEYFSDGWNMPDIPETVTHVAPQVLKEQGGRKRNAFKGHRNTGSNSDHDYRNKGGDADRSYGQSAPEITHTDINVTSKDSRGTGDRASHWQPKSQVFGAAHNRGSRSSGGHNNVSDVGREFKKDYPLDESPEAGHLEVKRDRRAAPFKGRTCSPNPGPKNTAEQTSTNIDSHHHKQQQQFHKNGNNQSSRSVRGHESGGGDWSSTGPENKHYNVPANRERQRQSSHYEYQPVGTSSKSNSFEGGSHGTGTKYRERGQGSSSRRGGGGHFYGRQSGGAVRVDDGYD